MIASIYWLIVGDDLPRWIAAITNLLLYSKFLFFFQLFLSFGKYFVIIIGVAKEVFPFLLVLFLIIIGFSHAFFILLSSVKDSDLTTQYYFVNPDGTNTTLYQVPDSNTNMFRWFPTSLLAMYLFLIGNNLTII